MSEIPWQEKDRFVELVHAIITAFRSGTIDRDEAFDDIRDAYFECLEKR